MTTVSSPLADALRDRYILERELSTDILKEIQAPTLVMAGDHDVIRLEHTVVIYRSLPQARLLIVPKSPHNTLREHADWLNPLIADFFAEK